MSTKGVVWDFEGEHLPAREVARINYEAGFRGIDALVRSVAVVLAESQGWTRAWHKNFEGQDPANTLRSTDLTFWQINDRSYPSIVDLAGSPDTDANRVVISRMAHDIYLNRGFDAWQANRDGGADKMMLRAINGVCNSLKARYGYPLIH